MGFRDKFSTILDSTVEISKNLGSAAVDIAKEKIDDKLSDMETARNEKKIIKAEEKTIKKMFKPNKTVGDLQIDTRNRLFRVKNTAKDKIFAFDNIIDFELLEDDISIISGGLGRALVGSALGPTGAIVGAVTGRKTSKKKITKLIVKLTLNNFDYPCIMINYIDKPTKTTSSSYKKAFNEAHETISVLNVMINN